jgi:glycosyltransferase involved in cell wall biosynthesis
MSIKISVITVVYNAGDFFEWTLKSVRDQKYDDLEYIIIDGGSRDNTTDLIEKYNQIITKWISEPDDGLYSAMNKGLHMATGDYIMFLNAGDVFYSTEVLKQIFSGIEHQADIYYGETMIMDQHGNDIGMRRLKAPEQLSWKSLIDGMLVCHQSFIVKKGICRDYNLKYKISADYDWMLNCLKNAKIIVNTHLIISRFLDGGLNKQNIRKALCERFLVMIRNYNFFLVVLNHFRIGVRFAVSYYKNKRF